MPSLDLENLAAYRRQPAPIGPAPANAPLNPGTPPACCASPSYNLAVEQGATLSSQITIKVTPVGGTPQPVDVTGYKFQFTAKTDPSIPDSDPSVVMINWQETSTPTQGLTWLVIPAATTAAMQLVAYFYQVRMVSPSNVVTPLVSGTLTICQPISARFT